MGLYSNAIDRGQDLATTAVQLASTPVGGDHSYSPEVRGYVGLFGARVSLFVEGVLMRPNCGVLFLVHLFNIIMRRKLDICYILSAF